MYCFTLYQYITHITVFTVYILGTIPLTVFEAIMNDKRLNNIPLILETPVVLVDPTTTDEAEVKLLYNMIKPD